MHAVSVPPLAGAAGGDTTNERLRMDDAAVPTSTENVSAASISRARRRPRSAEGSPAAWQLFFDANDRVRLRQLSLEPSVSRSNSAMRVSRILRRCLRSTLHRSDPAAPCRRQVLRLDEYNPSRRNKAAHIRVGFTHDSALILATESTPCRLLRDLRVWTIPSPTGRPARNSSRPTGSFRSARRFSSSLITNTGYRPSRPAH